MFDALKRDRVAEGQQRVIIGEVARPVKRKRFCRNAFVGAENARRNLEILRIVGEGIELDECAAFFPKRPLLGVRTQIHRRIDEIDDRRRRKVDAIAAFRLHAQRRAELPRGRQHYRSLHPILCRIDPVLIQQHAIPIDDREGRRRHDVSRRVEENIEVERNARDPLRNVEMERVHVDVVAMPRNRRRSGRNA